MVKENKFSKKLEYYKSQCKGDPELQAAYQAKLDHHFSAGLTHQKVENAIENADNVFDKLEKHLEAVSRGK